jgi:hypothetical protein
MERKRTRSDGGMWCKRWRLGGHFVGDWVSKDVVIRHRTTAYIHVYNSCFTARTARDLGHHPLLECTFSDTSKEFVTMFHGCVLAIYEIFIHFSYWPFLHAMLRTSNDRPTKLHPMRQELHLVVSSKLLVQKT